MLWVVTANSNLCKVYHYQKHLKKLTLIKELIQPENRLKNKEIVSDKPGRFGKTRDGTGGAFEPKNDAKAVNVDNFSRSIANLLKTAKQDKLYEKMILISDAHMTGLLNQHLDKAVSLVITQTIHKDLQGYSESELIDYLDTHLN